MDEVADSTFPNWPELRRLFTYDDLVGKVLQGRYEIVRRLGAGGMGVVFLARHVHLDKLFALKIISARFLDEPELGRRFLLEARAASKIDHPNVVAITDFGPPEEGPAFFVMEYLEGEDLARTLAREGVLPWPRAVHIVAQIARALAAAHARGVVHRDIKPQNCLRIARDGDPDFIKVLDFGLAKVLTETARSTWTVGGSPGYIAPEIYRGGAIDHRVDIFALGVVLHALVFGRLPAQPAEGVQLPPGVSPPRPSDLPPPLLAVIRRATDDDPERRYPSAEAMLAALAAIRALAESPSGHVPIHMSKRSPMARRALLFAPPAVAALAAVVAAASARSPEHEHAQPPSLALSAADSSPAPDHVQPPPATVRPRRDPAAPTDGPGASAPPVTAPPDSPAPPADPAPASPALASSTPIPSDPAPLAEPPPPLSPPGPSDPSQETGKTSPISKDTSSRPLPLFDEAAARAVLERHAADIRACKADSSFRNIATTVRLSGTVTVSARGRASVALPPGYDVNACLERLVARLRFRPSADGGRFSYTFLL